MSELETAQEMAETAVKQVNVFPLQGDKVDFLLNQLNQIASLPQLTIPQSIADELKEAIGATNFESTPYSIKLDEDGYLMMWASLRNNKLSEKTYKFCRDNTRVFDAYLNPLTHDLVKVVEG